jgi:hypothetical protein
MFPSYGYVPILLIQRTDMERSQEVMFEADSEARPGG